MLLEWGKVTKITQKPLLDLRRNLGFAANLWLYGWELPCGFSAIRGWASLILLLLTNEGLLSCEKRLFLPDSTHGRLAEKLVVG